MACLSHAYADRTDPLQPAVASGSPWPPQACALQAHKPDGGFALCTIEQLLLPWHAYQRGLITPLALRGYLGIREMLERRCEQELGTRACYRAPELQGLLGPAVRPSHVMAVISTLEAAGLVTWTETAVRLITHPETLRDGDRARYAVLRAYVHPLLYRVPVPRRMLRYLARAGSPGLIATTVGVVLQCLRYFRQDKQCRAGGTLSVAWLAHCFGLAERTAYRGLATLEALGWLATVPPPPEIRCPDGPWRVVNMAWDLPSAERLPVRAARLRRRPMQLDLFPLAVLAAGDMRQPPEDAATSGPPAGAVHRPPAPGGEGVPAASMLAAAQRAAHTGEPEDQTGGAWPEDQAAAGALVDMPACLVTEDLEARYAALPTAVQEALWGQARAHLTQQGTPPAFLIKPVVLAEVCRLLAQQGESGTPEAFPHAVEAADGCKNLAVDNRYDSKNLAAPLKELDPEPLQERQDPEPTPRGPTGAWPAEKHTAKPATLCDVQPEDLRALERLLALHHQAARRGWVTGSEADRLNVVAAAVHAGRVGQAPCRLFVALLRDRRWAVITQDDEDTARAWLREHRYNPALHAAPEAPAASAPPVPLADDARFVDLAQRVLRQDGWRGDPFLAVKLQYPAWTRPRWDAAQATLERWRLQQAQANARSQLVCLGALLDTDRPLGGEEESRATG